MCSPHGQVGVAPPRTDRVNTSATPLVSFATRLPSVDANVNQRPLAAMSLSGVPTRRRPSAVELAIVHRVSLATGRAEGYRWSIGTYRVSVAPV